MSAKPKGNQDEVIDPVIWEATTESFESRLDAIDLLSLKRNLARFTHSAFKPLGTLLRNLALILVVDMHRLDEPDVRNDPGYVNEAIQRLILQFIIDHRDAEFEVARCATLPPSYRKFAKSRVCPLLTSTRNWRKCERGSSSQCVTPASRIKRLRLSTTPDRWEN